MNILIVDDDPGTRLTVAATVERLGHSVVQAVDGRDGWRAFEGARPEVVITDWAMPGLDGTELAARVRAAGGAYTYIMVLTGRADERASREAMHAGADDVLAKPLDPAELERGLIAANRITAMHRRMRADARRDALTGAGTRARLEEDLLAVCARATRYGHAYCVAMVGVAPDTDDVLRRAGWALGRELRSSDVYYRSGPAEFVVVLPEQGVDSAHLAAARLREAVASAVPAGTAVSVGMATTEGAGAEPAPLLALAEAALERSAATGGVVGPDPDGTGALRLLVADDDPMSRLMLGAIVKRESGFELVGEAADAEEAIELALHRRPDVVLLAVNMPGGGGARAAAEIREGLPDVRIVAISADDSQVSQYDMMRAGAVGYITKGASGEEILRVIRSSARW